jgi:hypothetical protein
MYNSLGVDKAPIYDSNKPMNAVENFILHLPSGTLLKVSYAWFGVVVFYPWAMLLSSLLAGLLILSLLLLSGQKYIWARNVLRKQINQDQKPYVDQSRAPIIIQLRNLALALVVSGLVAYFLGGSLGLSDAQWFLIFIGFFLLQLDLKLFGAPSVYIIIDQGIAIGCADLKLFLDFGEIRQAEYIQDVKARPERWSVLAPVQSSREGVLLLPVRQEGFTRLIDQIFLVPKEPQQFLAHLPANLLIRQTNT